MVACRSLALAVIAAVLVCGGVLADIAPILASTNVCGLYDHHRVLNVILHPNGEWASVFRDDSFRDAIEFTNLDVTYYSSDTAGNDPTYPFPHFTVSAHVRNHSALDLYGFTLSLKIVGVLGDVRWSHEVTVHTSIPSGADQDVVLVHITESGSPSEWEILVREATEHDSLEILQETPLAREILFTDGTRFSHDVVPVTVGEGQALTVRLFPHCYGTATINGDGTWEYGDEDPARLLRVLDGSMVHYGPSFGMDDPTVLVPAHTQLSVLLRNTSDRDIAALEYSLLLVSADPRWQSSDWTEYLATGSISCVEQVASGSDIELALVDESLSILSVQQALADGTLRLYVLIHEITFVGEEEANAFGRYYSQAVVPAITTVE